MTSKALRSLLPPLLLLFCAAPALGQDFTLYLGHARPGELSDFRVTDLEGSAVWGFRLGTGFLPFVGLEHTIGFGVDYLRPEGLSESRDVKGFIYNSNLIVNAPFRGVTPYVTAGLGFIRQHGSPNLPVGTKFAINYGGGLKVPNIAGPLGMRLDVRGYRATNVLSESLNVLEVSAGLLIAIW